MNSEAGQEFVTATISQSLSGATLLKTIYAPAQAFRDLRYIDAPLAALFLTSIRWILTSAITIRGMYQQNTTAALPLPVDIDLKTYRFYELFWYPFFGLFCVILIAAILNIHINHHGGKCKFRKSFLIVSVAYFTPWTFGILGDIILLAFADTHPLYLVSSHLAVLTWETLLIAIGFNQVCHVSKQESAFLGLLAASLFLLTGFLVVR